MLLTTHLTYFRWMKVVQICTAGRILQNKETFMLLMTIVFACVPVHIHTKHEYLIPI